MMNSQYPHLFVACAKATLFAGLIVLNVIVRSIFSSEHSICFFHGFSHVIRIREIYELLVREPWAGRLVLARIVAE